MKDRIKIEGLSVETIIGVHDWERRQKQLIRIDLTLEVDIDNASKTDVIEDTVSYGDIARLVIDLAERSRYNLIESLASAIANAVLAACGVERLVVTVHKPGAIPNADDVSVTIERSSK